MPEPAGPGPTVPGSGGSPWGAQARPPAPGALVEVATWRPVQVVEVDGWRVGISGGFTRRGNSALPLVAPADVSVTLHRVEGEYRSRGLPAVVRVGSDAAPSDLDAVLAERGYRVAATTHVLVRRLGGAHGAPGRGAEFPGRLHRPTDDAGVARVTGAVHGEGAWHIAGAASPDEAWLAAWLGVKAARPVDHGLARDLLTGSPARYLAAHDERGVVGVIRAGHASEWVGLSCLTVAPCARRRGLAQALTTAALREAAGRGARQAFLQVEDSNRAAISLYHRLGFTRAETYHYRERDLRDA